MTKYFNMTREDINNEIDSLDNQMILYHNKLEKLEKQGKTNTFEYENTLLRIFGLEHIKDELVEELRATAEEYIRACVGK
jgi:hypothetical protein